MHLQQVCGWHQIGRSDLYAGEQHCHSEGPQQTGDTGWRNGTRKTNAPSCTWHRITLWSRMGWGLTGLVIPLRGRPYMQWFGHESAVHPCSNESQLLFFFCYIGKNIAKRSREFIIPLCLTFLRPHLEKCANIGTISPNTRDVSTLEQVQWILRELENIM